jgi:CheY-like chemotaxis protein
MGIFKNSKRKAETERTVKVFIVEDSKVYSAQLEHFLRTRFEGNVEIHSFPVAEVMDVKLEHRNFPDLIIMDYVLNARYDDAESGLEAIKRIKEGYPGIEIVLHSGDMSLYDREHDDFIDKCHFIPKTQEGMDKIAGLVEVIAAS